MLASTKGIQISVNGAIYDQNKALDFHPSYTNGYLYRSSAKCKRLDHQNLVNYEPHPEEAIYSSQKKKLTIHPTV